MEVIRTPGIIQKLLVMVRCGACYKEREFLFDQYADINSYTCERCYRENFVQAIYTSCIARTADPDLFWKGAVC